MQSLIDVKRGLTHIKFTIQDGEKVRDLEVSTKKFSSGLETYCSSGELDDRFRTVRIFGDFTHTVKYPEVKRVTDKTKIIKHAEFIKLNLNEVIRAFCSYYSYPDELCISMLNAV
jgi:hypothetical protein